MVTLPLEMTRGDTFKLSLTFTNKDTGIVINISGWKIFFTVKLQNSNSIDDSDAILKKTISIVDGTTGKIVIPIEPDNTVNITPGVYKYDMQLKDNSGNTATPFRGVFSIIADVTRRTE